MRGRNYLAICAAIGALIWSVPGVAGRGLKTTPAVPSEAQSKLIRTFESALAAPDVLAALGKLPTVPYLGFFGIQFLSPLRNCRPEAKFSESLSYREKGRTIIWFRKSWTCDNSNAAVQDSFPNGVFVGWEFEAENLRKIVIFEQPSDEILIGSAK